MNNVILVWRFCDAPEDLRALSTNGGDEDWLAVVPTSFLDKDGYFNVPSWIEYGTFGSCSVDRYDHPDGSGAQVFIGAHA